MKPIILIFEENDETRISVFRWLTGVLREYHILSARNLKEALAIIHSQRPDIVLVRIEMLQKECLKDIKKIKKAASAVQIVVMATHENEVYQAETPPEVGAYILKDGLISFLTKMCPSAAMFTSVSV